MFMTVEQIHSLATVRAKQFVSSAVLLLEVLEEVERNRVYLHFGYAGLWSYCVSGLKLSESDAGRFVSVIRTKVPELKIAVLNGTLSLPKAARIAPLLTPGNQTQWIEKASQLTSRALEALVVKENPKAMPRERITPRQEDVFELKTPVSQKVLDQLQALKDILSQKLRRPATTEEVLAFAFSETLKRHDPVQRAERNSGKLPSTLKVIPQGRIRHSNAVRHEVNLRDQSQCTAILPDGTRCLEKRFLDIHHKVPLSEGGSNHPSNLTLLCNGHHRSHHHSSLRGAAGDAATFARTQMNSLLRG